jgi:low affinity Fe/Cu permease
MKRAFEKFAEYTSIAMGTPWVFITAIGIILTWAASGPAVGYSEQWQLIINSFTTIVTFLMVFVIQNTQNRDFQALQLKLDALLLGTEGPLSKLASLHNLTEDDLHRLERAMTTARGRHDIDEIVQLLEKESTARG